LSEGAERTAQNTFKNTITELDADPGTEDATAQRGGYLNGYASFALTARRRWWRCARCAERLDRFAAAPSLLR
jgi:hypothetical protein